MSTESAQLNDLINVLEDGRNFYKEAAEHTDRADLKALFSRMARIKQVIANDLKTKVTFNGDKPSSGSFAGSVRKAYAEIRTRLASDTDAEYVTQLEEFEDRILKEFREQAGNAKDTEVRSIAIKYLPEVRRDHDEMRGLKAQMSH
jgi:uncharacterized protein (TIGR02284 family)